MGNKKIAITFNFRMDTTSRSEGRGPSDDEKKLREEIAEGAGRERPWKRENARQLQEEACIFEETRESGGNMRD
jgi:hypothetical protein